LKPESKLILALAVTLLLLEAGSRGIEALLSADVRQMLAQNEIPDKVRQAEAEGRASILVIGYSLARAGIIPEEIAGSVLSPKGGNVEVLYITPDASGINEWMAAYRKGFPNSRETVRPDFVIIATGPGHLADQPVATGPEKLSAYHVAAEERWEALTNWMPSLGERCRFVLAGISRLFANRERVRPLLFYGLVTGYEVTAQRLNESGIATNRPAIKIHQTAERLELLLDSLGIPPERVLIAAVPLPAPYELPAAVLEVAGSRKVAVYSKGGSSSWPSGAFPDGYHLGRDFGTVFSRQLNEQIRKQMGTGDDADR